MQAFIAQCKAELLRSIRNKRFLIFTILFPVAFYFIFTSVNDSNMKINGVAWKAYYLMSMTAFGLLNSSISSLGVKMAQERSQGWVRLLKITPLSSIAYVGSKIIATSIINLGIIIMMFLVGKFGKGVDLSLTKWVSCGGWLLLGSIVFLALGSLVGTTKKPETAQPIASIFQLGLAMLGGLWMPVVTMPKLMQDIAHWMPTYNFAQGPWRILAGQSVDMKNIWILAGYLVLFFLLSSFILKKQNAE
ncbi:ABC transporter permease [Bacillus sp. RG28]|uniref:ABC transporter permease n=1 Tax=Gottfriedia endophytica TaxID=2820819 RepID=A0A940SKG8_9BACI|nr:ABC transporter permease [Gottfriedia endophytica]MBP0726436.1 ABC transporter permease [Gottfriedia endophytica]